MKVWINGELLLSLGLWGNEKGENTFPFLPPPHFFSFFPFYIYGC